MKQQTTSALDLKLHEMAQRIRDLREIMGLSPEEMAGRTGVTLEEYRLCEAGEADLNFAFIYRCAQAFGVDVTDIIEGASPRLSNYTLTRAGEGQHIEHAHGMTYYNMAARFKKRVAEPLYVVAEYSDEAQLRPIECTTHSGQECDIVLSGQLKVQVGEHIEILNPGDIIYYNSTASHGMIATGGQDCVFYAIVLEGEDAPVPAKEKKLERRSEAAEREERIWERFIDVEEGEDGSLKKIGFKGADSFNFAFDVVDGLARRKPEKLAMLHVDRQKQERYFTFLDMSRYSSRAANYFQSLGIKRGDRVLLILKRHYQFWFAILGLHKIGAVALLASNQMMTHDLEYRYEAAGITAVVCTSNGEAGGGAVPRHGEDHGGRLPSGLARLRQRVPPLLRRVHPHQGRPGGGGPHAHVLHLRHHRLPQGGGPVFQVPPGSLCHRQVLALRGPRWAPSDHQRHRLGQGHVGQALRPVAQRGGGVCLRLRPL